MDFTSEQIEQLRSVSRNTDMVGAILCIIVLLTIILGVLFVIYSHKKAKRSGSFKKNLSNYNSISGTIISVTENTHTMKLYRKDAPKKKYENEKDNNKSDAQIDEEPKEVEKTRYDVSYKYMASDGKEYTGSFSTFTKNEKIEVGAPLEVMYNPLRPFASYTEFNKM